MRDTRKNSTTGNEELASHGAPAIGFGDYLVSGSFVEAVFENWESEFLQMAAYVVLTIFLLQKGSSESKPLGEHPETRPVREPAAA